MRYLQIAVLPLSLLALSSVVAQQTDVIELSCVVKGVATNMSKRETKSTWRINSGEGKALNVHSVDEIFEFELCESTDEKMVFGLPGKCGTDSEQLDFALYNVVIFRDGRYESRTKSYYGTEEGWVTSIDFAGTCSRKDKVW